MISCPSCRNRAMSAMSMIALPNDHRDKIVCQACGEVLRRRPMQTVGEALLVWSVVLCSAIPVALLGGNAGIAITICLVVFLGWVAPWQGMTYELSNTETDTRPQLPAAKLLRLPPGDPTETGAEPPNPGDPPS